MIPITGQQAAALSGDLRHLIQVLDANTRAQLSALPQWWGASELTRRWNVGRDSLVALLREHAGYVGERGHALSVHVDDVLRIDRILLDEYRARRAAQSRRVA